MLAENQLQTRLIATLFLLSAITMLLLCIQNYRYGLYELVYKASFLSLIFLCVSAYARFTPEAKHLKQVCFSVSIAALLLILLNSFDYPEEVKHWLYPLGLLSFIALSHKQANILNLCIVCIFSLILFFKTDSTSALTFAMTYCLFIALTSAYAQLHQKRSRTLVELEIRETLTNAYNYRHLEDTLKKEICRSDRTGKAVSLVAIEIDYFPQVTDLHGLSHTHELMKRFAETLRAMIRAGDSDYFDAKHTSYLLLPCTPSEGVLVIAERIRRTIEESSWPVVDSITVSLGCTTYESGNGDNSRDGDGSARKLINDTHVALMEAQKNGHNRVCLHSH